MQIPLSQPLFDEDEQREVAAVLKSGWVMQGPKVAEFETAVREFVGTRWAVAVSSCSTALHLALRTLDLKASDQVIVPSLTWIATAAAIEQCGAMPVFADIDRRTFNINPERVASLITRHTRAVIAVNLFGLAAVLPQLVEICERRGIALIEDAACSLGATVQGRQSGSFGRMGCFSFHPRKSITTGEGGMIVGNDPADERRLRSWRSHGVVIDAVPGKKQPFDLGDFDELGYNYRLTDLQAAVGVAQMRKLAAIIERRRDIASYYSAQLGREPHLITPIEANGFRHTYQSYVLTVVPNGEAGGDPTEAEARRNRMMLKLAEQGIATRPGTHAVHTLKYFREKYGLKRSCCPNAYRAMTASIALPLYPAMTQEQLEHVVAAVKRTNGDVGQIGLSTNKAIAYSQA